VPKVNPVKAVFTAVVFCSLPFSTIYQNPNIVNSIPASLVQDPQLQLEIPKDSWVRIFFREIDKRAKTAKLSSLRSVLPNDDLEARLWYEAGPFGLDGDQWIRSSNNTTRKCRSQDPAGTKHGNG
jgi:hypothetical protein